MNFDELVRFPRPALGSTSAVTFDVEAEMLLAAESIGGQRPPKLETGAVGYSKNADFYFPRDRVIAELKCLDKDQHLNEGFRKKATDIVDRGLKGKGTLIFGTVTVQSTDLPSSHQQEFFQIYRTPIRRIVRDAHLQIVKTGKLLGQTAPRGLLLVANNSHVGLSPHFGAHLLADVLRTNEFPHIHAAVYFSGNLAASNGPLGHENCEFWLILDFSTDENPLYPFIERLGKSWQSRLETIVGLPCKRLTLSQQELIALGTAHRHLRK